MKYKQINTFCLIFNYSETSTNFEYKKCKYLMEEYALCWRSELERNLRIFGHMQNLSKTNKLIHISYKFETFQLSCQDARAPIESGVFGMVIYLDTKALTVYICIVCMFSGLSFTLFSSYIFKWSIKKIKFQYFIKVIV